jgi:nicotinamidase/pyrazinamidase
VSALAFVDVDVQVDFCEEGGSLLVPGSPNALYRALTGLARARGVPIFGSVDSHAFDAWAFASNAVKPPGGGPKPNFPDHCVKGTRGWLKIEGTLPQRHRFVPNVPLADAAVARLADEVLRGDVQGLYFEKEVYSLFANPNAEALLAAFVAARPTRFVVYGVATDYCVKAAALGLRERGYDVVVLTDAIAGITEAGVRGALAALADAGCALATSAELGLS